MPSVSTAKTNANVAPSTYATSFPYNFLTIPSVSTAKINANVSSVKMSSSITTTQPPMTRENSILLIIFKISRSIDVTTNAFKLNLERRLFDVYTKGRLTEKRRKKRNTFLDSRVTIRSITRKEAEVDVRYVVIENNRTLLAVDAARLMNFFTNEKMRELLGYEVITRPIPAPTISPDIQFVSMLVKTDAQKNLTLESVKMEFEKNLARFYKVLVNIPESNVVETKITHLYHDEFNRTYIEFSISVNNIPVQREQILKAFGLTPDQLSSALSQRVLVLPYIPENLQPTEKDKIVQNMQINNVSNLTTVKQDISNKLARVYVQARLASTRRKRRKRALGSIDAVIIELKRLQDSTVDVIYYITDAGTILNATYATVVLKNLNIAAMSSITAPYTVNSIPAPLNSTLIATASIDDDYPSWFLPVVISSCFVFILIVLFLILCWRWKKGAPSKKVIPIIENTVHGHETIPKMIYASDPKPQTSSLRHPPSLRINTSLTTEKNGDENRLQLRPIIEKPLLREDSLRRKVGSRESISTRSNPVFKEEVSEVESTDEVSSTDRTHSFTQDKKLETPRKTMNPPSILETVASDRDGDSESDEEVKTSGKSSNSNRKDNKYSAGVFAPIAIMSDTGSTEKQPPVRFRTSVQPTSILPTLDLRQTSLVGRIIEEEDSIQQEIKTKADIERWRNKQRQREKWLGESRSKSRTKKKNFMGKKSWGRAQREIGAVLDPYGMQPIVRNSRRKSRRKYNMKMVTTDDEGSVELQGFKKLSDVEEKSTTAEPESDSDGNISKARERLITLIDEAFTSIKSSSNKHTSDVIDKVDGEKKNDLPNPSLNQPLVDFTPALTEPPPSHGRASVSPARHRRRFMNPQSVHEPYHHGNMGGVSRSNPPPLLPVATKNPLVIWDPVDEQRALSQSAYRPRSERNPYTYTDASGQLYFTPVQQTTDGMGGLIWSPYATEYAMENFYRDREIPTTFGSTTATLVDVPNDEEPGTKTGQSAEPLVQAIKKELFRLASGKTPVKHL
ncbi:uncharacterized protein LOC124454375 [Xenia sp. Carnegie-2017]|uniref:uncharacterized protein LOC124454375 n=1 Tax=Xenia sp. Carnegie-2017 TaxID=2897299 RepID=UPI001F044AB9|nr:uncharacterized protein LOC124454375 [Xenia sp. Carnegie-2017]